MLDQYFSTLSDSRISKPLWGAKIQNTVTKFTRDEILWYAGEYQLQVGTRLLSPAGEYRISPDCTVHYRKCFTPHSRKENSLIMGQPDSKTEHPTRPHSRLIARKISHYFQHIWSLVSTTFTKPLCAITHTEYSLLKLAHAENFVIS